MKSLSLLVFICFISAGYVFSNPIIPPPRIIISEIYFSPEGWVIEVVANDFYNTNNLDSLVIETSSGKSYFKSGITFINEQVLLITADSLKVPLLINSEGDFIHFYETFTGIYPWGDWTDSIKFGNYPGATCWAPLTGQSLSIVQGWAWIPTPWDDYNIYKPSLLTIQKSPSLGANPLSNIDRDTLIGYVYDMNLNPVKNVKVEYFSSYKDYRAFGCSEITTNADGFFQGNGLYSTFYSTKIAIDDSIYENVRMRVDLDSSNLYIIKLDNYVITETKLLKSEIDYSIQNFPNPSKSNTTFQIHLPSPSKYGKAIIKIYNLNGQIVKILPVSKNYCTDISINWIIEENIPNGEYVYSLEIDNKRIKSDKIIISR